MSTEREAGGDPVPISDFILLDAVKSKAELGRNRTATKRSVR